MNRHRFRDTAIVTDTLGVVSYCGLKCQAPLSLFYPGCQRRRVGLRPMKPLVTREKKSLVPRVSLFRLAG